MDADQTGDGEPSRTDARVHQVKPPLVSVIVGIYNHASYLTTCLDSLMDDGWENLELVVFNDGSTDRSSDVTAEWVARHPEVRVVLDDRAENLGFTRSLNRAIELATGTYVTLISADDAMLPGGIGARVEHLERHPALLAVFADCQLIDEHGRVLFERAIEERYLKLGMPAAMAAIPELIPLFIVHDWAVPGPVFLCRAEAYRQIGPYDESIGSEDIDMYLRLAAAGRLGFVNAAVSQYRVMPGSYYATRTLEVWQDAAHAARKQLFRFGLLGVVRFAFIIVRDAARRKRPPVNLPLLVAARALRLVAAYGYHRKRSALISRHMEARLRRFEGPST